MVPMLKPLRKLTARHRATTFFSLTRSQPPTSLFSLFLFPLSPLSFRPSFQIPAVASDPKLVVDGAWAPQLPSGAGPLGRPLVTPPNVEAKIVTLAKSLNGSSPKILPNLSGIATAQRASMNATQADLGLKQNLRRAGGEVINSVAGFADRLRTKGDAIMTW